MRVKEISRFLSLLTLWGGLLRSLLGASLPNESPSPVVLLEMALTPSKAYSGRIGLTQWQGNLAHAEDVRTYFSPEAGYRREYLSPHGTVERVLLSNGNQESLYLVRQKKVLTGNPISLDRRLSQKREALELLLRNYTVVKSSDDVVLGRPAWALEIAPKEPGKPHQRYRIDKETNVILESERFLPEGNLASRARFVRFKPESDLPSSLFDLKVSSVVTVDTHGLDPDYLTLADLHRHAGVSAHFPDQLPGGFLFESADSFELEDQPVICARYTDGLTAVSVFQTPQPVKSRVGSAPLAARDGLLDSLGTAQANHVLHWRSGNRHYTLIGDISADLMRQISDNFH